MVMGYFGIILTSPKWMINIETSKTKEWPSGRAYEVADELKKRFRPTDIFLKAEQRTKLGQLNLRKEQILTILLQQLEPYKLNTGANLAK